MFELKKLRYIAAIGMITVFILTVHTLTIREYRRCMGVEIIPASYIEDYQETFVDFSKSFMFNQQQAAVDRASNTIYIPQRIKDGTPAKDLAGTLTITNNDYKLKFINDDDFGNLKQSTEENHSFKLIAVKDKEYVKYNVVFTTLPVIVMEGTMTGVNEDNHETFSGEITICEPFDTQTINAGVQHSKAQWHYRGGTTYSADKRSYKLSLKERDNNNNNMELCGLGADDDWILNAMTYDDTKLKERLSMILWNQLAQSADYNYKMSDGCYAELIVDGVYEGLYLLQRRVDPKYLQLNKTDILLKGKPTYEIETVSDGYEIKNSHLSAEETYSIIENMALKNDYSIINYDNMVDINLYLEFGAMADNQAYKNIYYLLKDDDGQYTMHFIPWDTDMAFGVVWWIDGFKVYHDRALNHTVQRMEIDKGYRNGYPQYDADMKMRWKEMRETVFTEDNIFTLLNSDHNTLIESGAYIRNKKVEPLRYGGEDTKDNIESYIYQKLAIMDEKYLN